MPSHWIYDVLLFSLLLLNLSVQLWVRVYLQECCTYLQECWEKSICYLIIFYDSNHPGDTAVGAGLEKSMGGQKKTLRRKLCFPLLESKNIMLKGLNDHPVQPTRFPDKKSIAQRTDGLPPLVRWGLQNIYEYYKYTRVFFSMSFRESDQCHLIPGFSSPDPAKSNYYS